MNLKKFWNGIYRVYLLGPGPHLTKRIYRAAVSQRLRNTGLKNWEDPSTNVHVRKPQIRQNLMSSKNSYRY